MIYELLESIYKTIEPKYEEGRDLTGAKKTVKLTEDSKSASCKEITLKKTDAILVYKFDKPIRDEQNNAIPEPLLILSNSSPARSKCDYIAFYKHEHPKRGEKLYILIVNMKSTTKSNMEDQLLSGKILAEYLLQTSVRCHNSWHSNSKKNLKIQDYRLFRKEEVVFKEIAVYSKLPSPTKGTTKVGKAPEQVRIELECGKEHDLDVLIL